jgi:hypothetical protein
MTVVGPASEVDNEPCHDAMLRQPQLLTMS